MMPLLQKSKTAARDWLQGIDTALLRTVAAAAALCMLLAHGFAFTNLFPNHDSTVLVFDAQWTMYVLGRWAQNLYFPLVRGKIAAPWLIGAFSIVYLALTSYCITSLLHLKKWSAALLTGLLGTCASVTARLSVTGIRAFLSISSSGSQRIPSEPSSCCTSSRCTITDPQPIPPSQPARMSRPPQFAAIGTSRPS